MTNHYITRPLTLGGTFSFYVPSTDPRVIEVCGVLADAVTVKGPKGPATVRALRGRDWDKNVIFDRGGYNPKVPSIASSQWYDEQIAAKADRLLSAGTWVEWDAEGDSLKRAIETELARTEGYADVTTVLAVDYRWITKAPKELARALTELDHPVALVLAHPADPLSMSNAVPGLVYITRHVEDLSILRTDHGGFGALVYGASHAAIGLTPSYRHFVPVGVTGGGKNNDATPRIFVRELMDWFTAMTIAGWGASAVDLRCSCTCCRGRRLDRFFDPIHDAEAADHNRVTLANLANEILDAPREDRRRLFGQICCEAVDLYGPMGKLSSVIKPKEQLLQWTFA